MDATKQDRLAGLVVPSGNAQRAPHDEEGKSYENAWRSLTGTLSPPSTQEPKLSAIPEPKPSAIKPFVIPNTRAAGGGICCCCGCRQQADPSSGFALVRNDRSFPDSSFFKGSQHNARPAGFPGVAFGLTWATALQRSPTASASTNDSGPCRRTTRSARADTRAARGAHRRWSPSGSAP